MTSRTGVLPLGFGLSAVLCFGPAGSAEEPPPKPPRPPVRVYTNEDLARVHPFRAETGVDSVPAVTPSAPEREPRASGRGAAVRGEAYWRREAERTRTRMRALLDQADTLRARIAFQEERRQQASRQGRRGTSASAATDGTAQLRLRLAQVERRMRELEEDLADRARREGALPGWLR